MSGQPSISVIIPVHNAAHFLSQQLHALGAQANAPAFEVLVVLNRSTDRSAAVAQRAAQECNLTMRLIEANDRLGVSYARNVGLAHATQLFCICDADDLVSPSWVAAMHATLQSNDLAGGPLRTFSQVSGVGEAGAFTDPALVASRIGPILEIPGGNIGGHTRFALAIGGYDMSYGAGSEDMDFAWRAAIAGAKTAIASEAKLHYRSRGSLSAIARQQWAWGYNYALFITRFRSISFSSPSPLRSIAGLVMDLASAGRQVMRGSFSLSRVVRQVSLRLGAATGLFRFGAQVPPRELVDEEFLAHARKARVLNV